MSTPVTRKGIYLCTRVSGTRILIYMHS